MEDGGIVSRGCLDAVERGGVGVKRSEAVWTKRGEAKRNETNEIDIRNEEPKKEGARASVMYLLDFIWNCTNNEKK